MALTHLVSPAGWFIPAARRLLYTWVRTTAFPADPAGLVDPAKPVCYVLQDRHLSNRLVLFEETRRVGLPLSETGLTVGGQLFRRAFFFLYRARDRIDRKRGRIPFPALLARLINLAIAEPQVDVQLVPVVILWGRSPAQQDSVLRALLSETWRPQGFWRQALAILLHGRNVHVRFNRPISLQDLLQGGLDETQALRKVSRVFRVHFRRQRQMAIGPDISHRNTQVNAVLANQQVRMAIAEEAKNCGISLHAARERAAAHALEIASDYSYGVVRALELLLTWLWAHLYEGLEVHNFESVTQIAAGQEIVYVPCHRSHIDYLLLSYLIHRQGLTPPHIAAGANLNLPLVGNLLRRGGAFFLRRSFKGQALYAAVFDAYLHLMLARGFPIEYFIEGGRSRSGRMLAPKAGILGMTVHSFLREHIRPLIFVPTYIGYEKVIEGRTYAQELAGQPKERESLLGLLRSLRNVKREFGRVHVNFGEPLALTRLLDECHPDWRKGNVCRERDWAKGVTRAAAGELAKRINEAAVINPVNLLSLALLATPKHTADERALLRMLGHYLALHEKSPYAPVTIGCAADPQQIVTYVERLCLVERFHDPLGDLIRIPPAQAPLLTYCRNNVLHLFALPALLACLLSHNLELEVERIHHAIAGIYRLMRTELFLRWPEDALQDVTEKIIEIFVERSLLRWRVENNALAAPDAVSQEFAELHLLGESIRPLLERHFLTLALLQLDDSRQLTRHSLEEQCHRLAQRLSLLYDFNAPDIPERAAFAAFIANLIEGEILTEEENGRLVYDERLLTPLAHSELVLSLEARQSIRRIAATATTPS